MDSAQHCLGQSAECRRLVHLARSEAEAHAMKNLSRTWLGLAGQIDRYNNALMREQRRGGQSFFRGGLGRAGTAVGVTRASRRSEMTDEDLINERLLEVLQLLDSIPLSSPEQGEQILKEVTEM
jgi:hypothetical protein